ncbi:16S rRNA (guanine(966)-N(2))-methyltransferase RsmD [Bacillaceae bacterium SIJ1]|uniref:16S rRNA (guanine(966)-N(2))-methyltransferase RsmD n=1 Tax=Litoribacterium kuwaitense TaxID=1398745 RepID=UPI0013ECF49F|nr:16S rRNA (guanine(966)-N(2))-methyltransferase RsmD [Litoribacterium kuwaitense]NGP44361.1 16S rRNA (guanine(966)-N(2))-methyltransferase RsmD [Litoribacterium kuwaitense]
MRIIAGSAKGHPLKTMSGQNTRPTSDKVKESLFQMIGPFFHGGTVLDLFGGSGSLGIEALSRGMDQAVFVDKSAQAVHVIQQNLEKCHFADQATVYRSDALKALAMLAKKDVRFDLVFLDPPYALTILPKLLQVIDTHQLLLPKGLIVAEHDQSVELPEALDTFTAFRKQTYGSQTQMTLYEAKEMHSNG